MIYNYSIYLILVTLNGHAEYVYLKNLAEMFYSHSQSSSIEITLVMKGASVFDVSERRFL
jgi:hypothetical protein